jgi:hypothetical protein
MTRHTRRRRAENAQAFVETALVLPLFLIIILGMVGVWVRAQILSDLRLATTAATAAALAAPAGAPDQAKSNVTTVFGENTRERGWAQPTIDCPTGHGTDNFYISNGRVEPDEVIYCDGAATISFKNSPLGLVWRWDMQLTVESGHLPVPANRQCAPGVPTC